MRVRRGKIWSFTVTSLVALTLTCSLLWAANPQQQAAAKSASKDYPSEAAKKPARLAAQAGAASDDYVIGPDDLLAINVWREPEISRAVPVRPDGKISLPLVGELEAGGLTPIQLRAKLTARLKTYLSNPEVTVIVQEVRSQRFNVVGEVQRPGSYMLTKPMTVLDAIALAGGFREFAKVTQIYVLRRGPESLGPEGYRRFNDVRILFNYKDVIGGKKSSQNVQLEPNDTVVVP